MEKNKIKKYSVFKFAILNEYEKYNNNPNSHRIIPHLRQLIQHFPPTDPEFLKIIWEIYTLNPKFYLQNLYPRLLKKSINIQFESYRREMFRSIIEKYCLMPGEEILHQCRGTFIRFQKSFLGDETGSLIRGPIIITNERIITIGKIKFYGNFQGPIEFLLKLNSLMKYKEEMRSGSKLSSLCYGFQFPITPLDELRLSKWTKTIKYQITLNGKKYHFHILVNRKSNDQYQQLLEQILKSLKEIQQTNLE